MKLMLLFRLNEFIFLKKTLLSKSKAVFTRSRESSNIKKCRTFQKRAWTHHRTTTIQNCDPELVLYRNRKRAGSWKVEEKEERYSVLKYLKKVQFVLCEAT